MWKVALQKRLLGEVLEAVKVADLAAFWITFIVGVDNVRPGCAFGHAAEIGPAVHARGILPC